ncbi:hypothetical protein D3C85_1499160 [compost metagenome]
MAAAGKHQHAELVDLVQRVPARGFRLLELAELRHTLEDFALCVAHFVLLRPLSAPVAPEDLGAHIVQAADAGEVPGRVLAHGVQLALQPAPVGAFGNARGCPVAFGQRRAGRGIKHNRRIRRRRHEGSGSVKRTRSEKQEPASSFA